MTVPKPTELADIITDLRRRVERLERSDPLRRASVTDDAITFYDAAGTRRVVVGKQDTGSFGLRVYDSAGTLIFSEDGI
jgi:hypothetical protein